MSTVKLYSVFDKVVCEHGHQFFAPNDGAAIRVVKGGLRPGTQLFAHPSDFSLVRHGEFDTATGVLTPTAPEHLSSVVSLMPVPEDNSGLFDEE